MPDIHLLTPIGFAAANTTAGIKASGRPDVGLLVADAPCPAAALFTTNRVVAAPVVIGARHIAGGRLRAVVVNSGNANACTGARGLRDAIAMCRTTAQAIDCPPGQVLPSSTGIIGHHLPLEKVTRGIRQAATGLGRSAEHATAFADAICTTDTRRKTAGISLKVGRQVVHIAGCCKGAGMIGPRLGPPQATMLAYLTTDARIAPAGLASMLRAAADDSFNALTIDDHASTNDTLCLLASGASGAAVASGPARAAFAHALRELCVELARQIAADGEGATKVVRIEVTQAADLAAARAIARTIANSALVKCAMHGNDPNWGRIVSAAGYAGVKFNPDRATLKLQGVAVFRRGAPTRFDAAALSKALAAPEVRVELTCGLGHAAASVLTCDLSREYVAINADYHT